MSSSPARLPLVEKASYFVQCRLFRLLTVSEYLRELMAFSGSKISRATQSSSDEGKPLLERTVLHGTDPKQNGLSTLLFFGCCDLNHIFAIGPHDAGAAGMFAATSLAVDFAGGRLVGTGMIDDGATPPPLIFPYPERLPSEE